MNTTRTYEEFDADYYNLYRYQRDYILAKNQILGPVCNMELYFIPVEYRSAKVHPMKAKTQHSIDQKIPKNQK